MAWIILIASVGVSRRSGRGAPQPRTLNAAAEGHTYAGLVPRETDYHTRETPSDAGNATKGKGFRTYQKTFVTKYEFPTAVGLMPPSRRIVDAVHSENIQCRCLVLARSGFVPGASQ
jgi:hypothetical protein